MGKTGLNSDMQGEMRELRKGFVVLDPLVLRDVYLNFLKELERASRGEKSSLSFIVHTASSSLIHDSEVFQVMVVGGSVFKEALVRKDGSGLHILDKKEEALPLMQSKDDLMKIVERHLRKDIAVLAINFAYPLSPVFEEGKLDGVLVAAMKEHTFEGLVGERVGRQIEQYFRIKHNRTLQVTVANDTVCLLLSGLTKYTASEIAGGIVGTGTNFAVFLDADRLVNLESANFDTFPLSHEAAVLDAMSSQPGRALFEKETAGAYLYQQFNALLLKHKHDYPAIDSTWDLKKLAEQAIPFVSPLACLLIEKSAALIAAEMAAIAVFMKNTQTIFVMEGSFFWSGEMYRDFVKEYLDLLLPGNGITFVHIEESPYLGAAKLVG